MPSFAISISILGLVQAALVALPGSRPLPAWLSWARNPWWALIPALSIVVVITAIELDSNSARWLSYLALAAVPPLAVYALGALVRVRENPSSAGVIAGSSRAGPGWLVSVGVVAGLFGLAWASADSLAAEAAATALTALACIALGWLLVSVVPAHWLRLGVYAMAAIDTVYVAGNLLKGPNAVLSAAAPAAGLPRLQSVHFGSALMGFGDLFAAALLGCLLAAPAAGARRRQLCAAGLVAGLALAFDLLFFAVDELPATVPVAVALALVQRWWR